MDFGGKGLALTIGSEDGDGDVCLDGDTSKIHLLFKRKELDLVIHEDPRGRRRDQGLENNCSKKARREPNIEVTLRWNIQKHKEALFSLGLDSLKVFGFAQEVVVNQPGGGPRDLMGMPGGDPEGDPRDLGRPWSTRTRP